MSNRDRSGRFLMGHNGGPGRPKGSRNKLSEAFFDDMLAVWEEKGRDAIHRVADQDPVAFLRIIVSVLPKEIEVTRGNPLEEWSDEELTALDAILASIRSQAADDEGGEQEAA